MATVVEILAGTAVEVVIFGVAGGVLYRVWRGASFLPQRKTLLPFNRGVVLEGEKIVKILEPGRHWIKPKQTILPVDTRQRPFRMDYRDSITADRLGLRLRLSGEYQVDDPSLFVRESSDGHAAFYLSLEREIPLAVAESSRAELLDRPSLLTDRIHERMEPRATRLGVRLNHLDVADMLPIAWVQEQSES